MTPKFFMMVGLVASGKSTKSKELSKEHNATVFSSDALRAEWYGDENIQGDNTKLFEELHRRIKDCLKDCKNAIYDATNINYKRRMAFLAELANIPCEKICVAMAIPYEECLRRNAERDRKVPEHVITRMYHNFNIPYWYEGWDDINIEYGAYKGYYGKPVEFVRNYKDYNQHNSHHELTLGEHCLRASLRLDNEASITTFCATYIHDCGKPETATFTNSKGMTTTECHYYNHQYVSGYKALLFDYSNPLDVAIIVMWHMQPYFWEKDKNEKLHNKYRKLWGEQLYNYIMFLHIADKNAH
jgi:predicted kinase